MLPSYNFDPNIWNSQGNDQNQQSLFSTSIQNYNQLTQQLGAMQRQGGQPNADYGNNLYGPIGMGSMPWGNYSSRNGIPNNLSNVGQSEGRTLFIGTLRFFFLSYE
ncbi:hypothetical protein M1146_05650 [Patescibacteria group bacterium]|nr:hypothetical protein [Patescibacteria group bacterium]